MEQFVTQLAVERFHVPVLPGTGLLDIQRTDLRMAKPALDLVGNELETIIRADVLRAPRTANRYCSISFTSLALNERATSIARHSRVYSSITFSIRSLPPRIVVSCMKSHVHT